MGGGGAGRRMEGFSVKEESGVKSCQEAGGEKGGKKGGREKGMEGGRCT